MKKSIITIKYILLLSVVFLLLTYSISLNDENKWVVLNTPWISHNFAFAIIGGVFASLLVILTFIEESMESIDEECENRYHWDEVKRSTILGEENFVSADLDSFLRKQNEV